MFKMYPLFRLRDAGVSKSLPSSLSLRSASKRAKSASSRRMCLSTCTERKPQTRSQRSTHKKKSPKRKQEGLKLGCYRHEQCGSAEQGTEGIQPGERETAHTEGMREAKAQGPSPSTSKQKGRQHKGEPKQLRLMIFRTEQDERY